METGKHLTHSVHTRRMDALGSESTCNEATITLDTAVQGRSDAFDPAELLLAALLACIIKGIERVAPPLNSVSAVLKCA